MNLPVQVAPPAGYWEIINLFGDLTPYIKDDGVIDSKEMSQFLKTVQLPFHMLYAFDRSIIIRQMTCHKIMAPIFLEVLTTIAENELDAYCPEFGGCYCYRAKRASSKLSTHSWGIAVDLNPRTNQYGTKGDMNKDIIGVFKGFGFTWGGDWKTPDPMHFQYARNY